MCASERQLLGGFLERRDVHDSSLDVLNLREAVESGELVKNLPTKATP
jgi:hypothetical protein